MLMFRIFSSYPKFNVANRTDRTEFFSWNDNKVWFMANAILLCGISTDFKYYISYNGYNNASIFLFCLSLKRTLPHFFATAPQLWSPYHLLDHYLGDDVATEILLYYAINQHTIVASSLSNKSKHIEALYYSQSILTKYGVTRDSIKGWGVSKRYYNRAPVTPIASSEWLVNDIMLQCAYIIIIIEYHIRACIVSILSYSSVQMILSDV